MQSKSSINFQTSRKNSTEHMSRKSKVSYLIEHDNNKYEYKLYEDKEAYLEFAKIQTKLKTKRKMQTLATENFVQEAVLNIKKDTTIEEVENLFKAFNKEFNGGFKVFEIALHKDEGVFIDTEYNIDDLEFDSTNLKILKDGIDVSNEVISLAPNRDIFYNKATKKWYEDEEFTREKDTTKLQKKMNYHAHINFTKWEENTGKNIRLLKRDLQNIQTMTAEKMGMTRGVKNSKTVRMNHYQIKKMQSEINDLKIENKRQQELLSNGAIAYYEPRIEELKLKAKEIKSQTAATMKELQNKLKNQEISKELFWSAGAERKQIKSQEELDIFIKKYTELENKALQDTKQLKDELEQSKESYKVLSVKANKIMDIADDYKTKNEKLENENQELKNQIKELQEELEKLRPELKKRNSERQKIRKEVNDLERKIEKMTEEQEFIAPTLRDLKLQKLKIEHEKMSDYGIEIKQEQEQDTQIHHRLR